MLISEELALTAYADRLAQARAEQQGHRLAVARRLTRKAERAALKARLALARVI